VHIITGPLFIICWNMFPRASPYARYYAAVLPGLITLKFALNGLEIIKDPETVKSMSRSGNPRELLYGPLFYGVIFVISTILYWGDSPLGITSLMFLCMGDGFAGLLGENFGKKKLFWNKNKSWLGSISFFSIFSDFNLDICLPVQ